MKKKTFDGLASETEAKFWPMPQVTESVADYISRAFLPVPMTDRGEIVHKGMELNGEVVGGITVGFTSYDVYNEEGDPIVEDVPRAERIKTAPKTLYTELVVPWEQAKLHEKSGLSVKELADEYDRADRSAAVLHTNNDPYLDTETSVLFPDGKVIEILWFYDGETQKWIYYGMRFGTKEEVLVSAGESSSSNPDDGEFSHPDQYLGAYVYQYNGVYYVVELKKGPAPYFKTSKQGYPVIQRGDKAWVLFRETEHHPLVVTWGYDPATGEWSHGTYVGTVEEAARAINELSGEAR